MATYTIGTTGGGYYNNRGLNNPPYNYGTAITVTNGQCWLVTDVSIQMAGNGSTETVYGHIWNSSGTDYWQGSAVSIASDTSAPFTAKNLGDPGRNYLLNNISGANDTWYVGFSKAAASDVNWDVQGASGTSTGTATGDTANGNLTDFSPSSALARKISGTFTYTSVTAPSTPTLTATPGNGQVSLSWTTPANGGDAINGYTLKRGSTQIYPTLPATVGTATSFTDTGLTNGTLYSYTVTATNNVGTSGSGSASATPRTVPSAPTSFTSTANTLGTVALSWVAPVNNGNAISSYTLTRTNGATTVTLTAPATNVTTYSDTTVDPAVSYTYTLLATNDAGAGASASTTFTSLRVLDNKLYSYDSISNAWEVSDFGELLAPKFNYYTSSGSFTIPTGAKVLNIVCIGGGGGGGGGARNVANNGGGGGGGGGGFSERMFSAFELGGAGTVISYTVGSGGTGGTVTATGTTALSGNAGGVGGDSSFGTFLVAKGGGAGRTGANGVDSGGGVGGSGMWIGNSSAPAYESSPTSIYAGGGAGGNGGYASINNMLGAGISACTSLTASTTASQAGISNTSYNAPAGGGAGAASSTTTPSVGGAGGLPGGGGGGGGEGSTGGASGAGGAGGAGGGGLVAITVWYG